MGGAPRTPRTPPSREFGSGRSNHMVGVDLIADSRALSLWRVFPD
jgi:hypothetical protein